MNEVVCHYNGKLLSYKEGKTKYESTAESAMGYMFLFSYKGKKFYVDATEDVPGPGRLINHSKCHENVSLLPFYYTAYFNLVKNCVKC